MKTLQQFNDDQQREDSESEIGELMTDSAVNDAQRMSDRLLQLRLGLRQLLSQDEESNDKWSRYFNDVASSTRQEFAATQQVLKARRADFRLLQFRRGLEELLMLDDERDERWLEKCGVTKWDTTATTEDSDPAKTAASREVATAKRQELTAKRRVLQAKQADLAVKQRNVQRDIAKTGETR